MNKNKLKKSLFHYNILGKALFTCALASLGLLTGGPLLAAAGIIIGVVSSDLLAKHITNN